jgi:WD40 repeat protein
LPLPQAATSPAGIVLYAAFFAPGAKPSEPRMFQVTIDERGQFVIPPFPFTWTTLNDNRMVVGRLTVSPNDAYLTSVYDTEAGESVIVIDLTAAQETAYIWGGQLFSWHPNGVELLFEQSSQANPGLWLVEARTGRYRLLAQPSALSYANLSGAAISPDGHTLAYSISGPGIEQIWMANADGSEPHLVLESNTSAIVYAWSPDGRYLLYGGEPMPEAGKGTPLPPWPWLWVMDRTGQNRRSLNLPWDTFGFTDQKPVWSPTGQYIAGVGGIGEAIQCWRPGENQPIDPLCLFRNAGVYVEDVETGEVRLVAQNAVDPTWSPDGSLLALSRMDERGQVDIWVVDVNGNNLRRVTDTPELDRYPMWLETVTRGE